MEPQAAQTAQDPRLGIVLQDRYRILRKLGDGGMGAVYEGEHIQIKRRVAIKVLHSQFAHNPEIVARFHREAEAANSIGHPNIVEVTDMGSFPDGAAYMVLEFLKGRDWAADIEREGPQPLGKVVHIMTQVCDALAAAHAKNIVHRDLKPENIYLIERGGDPNFAKVLDFGISKIADAGSENRSLTQTGTALGTPYYMAPEQCQGKKDIDARADIYSLGVILFQALTRQYPFDDESYPMLVLKICTEPPPALSHYRPDVPPQLQGIVNRMLAKDRNQRFSSCQEVRAALEPFRGVHDAPVIATNAPSTASRGPSVLQQHATGPVMTPTGTAYLQSSPDAGGSVPGMMPAPAPAKSGSSKAIFAIVGGLAFLALAGGILGTVLALTRHDGDAPTPPVATHPDPVAASPHDDPAPPPVQPPVPVPAAVEPPPTNVPSTQPTVRIQVTVEGPSEAEVTVDGVPYGHAPFDADMPRDPQPEPGEEPAMHTIVASAEGWQTATEERAFLVTQRVVLHMERESGSRAQRRGAHHDADPDAHHEAPPRPTTTQVHPVGAGASEATPPSEEHREPSGGRGNDLAPNPLGNHGGDLVGRGALGL